MGAGKKFSQEEIREVAKIKFQNPSKLFTHKHTHTHKHKITILLKGGTRTSILELSVAGGQVASHTKGKI